MAEQSPRFIAAEILTQLFASRQSVKAIFDRLTSRARLTARDRGLCRELVYGVLRHRQNLDRALVLLSSTPLKKIDPFLRTVLAVGLYQIFFLDRIPESAAVNEAVNSCRAKRKPPVPKRLQGFVNGVLRSAVRRKEELQEKMLRDDNGQLILNHPQWLTDRWRKRLGEEKTIEICTVDNALPLLTLRINSGKIDRDSYAAQLAAKGIAVRPGQFSPDALLLPNGAVVEELPGYADGFFQVQDQAAQLASRLLAPFTATTCLDACAGLGGKTGHILQLFPQSAVHAVEPEPFRAEKLQALASPRLTRYTVDLLTLDPHSLPPCERILVDAPCSGLGVLGRQPDIRWNRRPEDVTVWQKQQLALLSRAALFAADNAVLVYATCSTEPEEDEEVVKLFLASHPEFHLTNAASILPRNARGLTRGDFFAPLPQEEIDGFFAARLTRGRV